MDCDESLPEDQTIQDIPMILSPQLRDVFPIFISMLDIKSFMKFAMTSKETYKRCMEDKQIRITVNENDVRVSTSANGLVAIDFNSSIVKRNIGGYLAALQRLPCVVNMSYLDVTAQHETEIDVIHTVRRYLEELRVNRVQEFVLFGEFEREETLVPLLKDFKVEFLWIKEKNITILRSILQLNLKELSYNGSIDIDLLLEVNSPIQNLFLQHMEDISKAEFIELLWKIQTGSLAELRLSSDAFDFSLFNELPFDHEGALPEEGFPLFLRRRDPQQEADFCWFLHWQGGVTACTIYPQEDFFSLYKCDPTELPWILRKEEDICKDLTERRPRVFCRASQFQTFSASFTMLDSSHEGPLPSERPLYCRVSENRFFVCEKDDILMECIWDNGCTTWKPFLFNTEAHYESDLRFDHPALAKYVFWKLIKGYVDPFSLFIYCENREELNSWFEDCKKFNFDYLGPLPDERPVVFERIVTEKKITHISLVVLLEEDVYECKFAEQSVVVMKCEESDRPPLMRMTADAVKEILQDNVLRSKRPGEKKSVFVELQTFLDGFELFKASPIKSNDAEAKLYVGERRKTNKDGEIIEERWFGIDGRIRKATWEKGRLHFSACYLNELPFDFVKKFFIPFVQMKYRDLYYDNLSMGLEQFRSCLEQFTVVPFDYSGSLKSDSPLAFVKEEIRHTCGGGTQDCNCSDQFIRVCFLWKDMRPTYCTWGEFRQRYIFLRREPVSEKDAPLVLRSKEYLEIILQGKFSSSRNYQWFGSFDDVLACLNDYKTLPFDYDGPLPEERPLVFEKEDRELSRFILREDGTLFECLRQYDRVLFRLSLGIPTS